MRLKGLIVIGTDTGVGKTIICGAIANALAKKDIKLKVFKPFATGSVFKKKMGAFSEDALFLKKCARSDQPLSEITPCLFKSPLAPAAAGHLERKRVNITRAKKILCNSIDKGYFTLVEGIGGLLVPLTNEFLLADFISDINLPVLLVSRSSLGTINHTLLTLYEIGNRNIPLVGVIFNRLNGGKLTLAEKTSPLIIQKFFKFKNFGMFQYIKDINKEKSTPVGLFVRPQKSILQIIHSL